MARCRVPALLLLLGLFSALGCDENPVFAQDPNASSNLVQNGGFERPRIRGAEYFSYSAGDPFTGWSIDQGAIDQLSGPIWQPVDGSQCLDMDGSCGTGEISQDLATEAGLTYVLHFALAGNPNGSPVVKALEIGWGDAVLDTVHFDTTGRSKDDLGWTTREYVLTAPSSVTRLTFRSLSAGCYGAILDAVSVRKLDSI
jgi:choice-of-anchor C domain-containing protein